MPLHWPHSPKGAVAIPSTKSSPHTAQLSLQCPTCHCLHSVPEDRSTLLQAELALLQDLVPSSQYPIPQHPKRMCHPAPHPKTRLLCQDCSEKEFWAGGCLLQRCPQAQGRVTVGTVLSAARQAIFGLVVVLITLPVVLRCHAGLQQGEVCQVELV